MDTALIRPTDIERLATRYKGENKEKLIAKEQEEQYINLLNIITRRINFAYTFLRGIGKPHSNMSIEEFNAAQLHLRSCSEAELARLRSEVKKTFFLRIFKIIGLEEKIAYHEFILQNDYNPGLIDYTFKGQLANYPKSNPANLSELVGEVSRLLRSEREPNEV